MKCKLSESIGVSESIGGTGTARICKYDTHERFPGVPPKVEGNMGSICSKQDIWEGLMTTCMLL